MKHSPTRDHVTSAYTFEHAEDQSDFYLVDTWLVYVAQALLVTGAVTATSIYSSHDDDSYLGPDGHSGKRAMDVWPGKPGAYVDAGTHEFRVFLHAIADALAHVNANAGEGYVTSCGLGGSAADAQDLVAGYFAQRGVTLFADNSSDHIHVQV